MLIEANVLTLADGGRIDNNTFGPSQGGSVTIRVRDTFTITGSNPLDDGFPSGIVVQANRGSGSAGDVRIDANVLILADGGLISGSTFDTGDGGSITVRVRDTFTITGSNPFDGSPSRISASSFGASKGGNVTINARELRLAEGAQIAVGSTRSGNAGNISITVTETFVNDGSEVRTSAMQADGGDIDITARFIYLRDGQITTSVSGGDGAGGNITLNARVGLLEGSDVRANAVGGPGGNITVRTEGFITDTTSQVDASSTQRVDGTVEVQGITDLSGSIVPVDPSFASAQVLLRQRCAKRFRGGQVSSFVVGGEAVPQEPEGALTSPLMARLSGNQAVRRSPSAHQLSRDVLAESSLTHTPRPHGCAKF